MNIKLSDALQIPVSEYAIQGNAVLGIRDSGKSYTATYMAEQLLDARIPFIAFDPIGVWRGLKYGQGGHAGYPVVVAGGVSPDIQLKPERTGDIVRAAMKENVPLVLDLYSVEISKAEMKRIVLEAINVLLYENSQYGIRHVFIEEAAEFVPQKIAHGGEMIYAAFDKLGRMGGNVGLGYTLINQRAADVNKSILELCNTLFLHKQTGSNSIQALEKWLKVAGAGDSQKLAADLATLDQGECYVWLPGFTTPERVKIPEKNTIHPDRRKPQLLKKEIPADVTGFVERLSTALKDTPKVQQTAAAKNTAPVTVIPQDNPAHLATIAQLQNTNQELRDELARERSRRQGIEGVLARVRTQFEPQFTILKQLYQESSSFQSADGESSEWGIWLQKFEGKRRLLLETLIKHKRMDRPRLCRLAGISYKSSGFDTAIREFQRLKLVRKEGNDFVLENI